MEIQQVNWPVDKILNGGLELICVSIVAMEHYSGIVGLCSLLFVINQAKITQLR